MVRGLSEEQWRSVLELSQTAAELPSHERLAFLQSSGSNPEVIEEVLALLEESDPSAEQATRVGTRIGRFAITASLSRGGMGEVYSARDTELGRAVALKFLTPEVIGLHGAVERFIREAQTASALNHPNIVTIHEVLRCDSTVAIVMELVEGITLRELCARPVPVRETLKIGQQISQALAAAHAQGIVHRDIKPENVILRPDGCVKLLDFGLARSISPAAAHGNWTSHPGLPAGTWRYMSPEQARGENVTAATDIFSLGLVLYELSSGKHPFAREDAFETLQAIVTADVHSVRTLNPQVPQPLDSLILSMLSKEASKRPSAEEVATKLGEMLDAQMRAAVVEKRETTGGRRGIWIAALAVSVLLAATIGWFLFRKKNAPEFSNLKIEPLTSQAGWEGHPALSPDGQSIAFTWTERLDGLKQIYVKRLNGTQPVEVTNSQSGDIGYLAWSPDGKRIAFKRQYGRPGAIYTIRSTGGDEHKVLDLMNADVSSAIDWSPDGSELVFSDALPDLSHLAIYIYNLTTGEKRKLISPAPDSWGDWDPKFSPDGKKVAFKRVTSFWADNIYIVPAAGGTPRRVTAGTASIWGHAWTADGKSLIVSCQRNSTIHGIWKFPVDRKAQPELIARGGMDAITPSTNRKTNRIAWANQLWDLNIYRVSASGLGTPVRLIASTVRDQGAKYSPDGNSIAFFSDRGGSREIWIAKPDGERQTRLTNFSGPALADLQWSPDGRHLIFDGRVDGRQSIFTLDCDTRALTCGAPKRIPTAIPAEDPSWSADGQFIYFASGESLTSDLWKQAAAGGPATRVTTGSVGLSRESREGKWLYFSKIGTDGIWRMPGSKSGTASSQQEKLIIGPPYKPEAEGWALTSSEIVFIDRATKDYPPEIRAYDIVSKKVRSILAMHELFPESSDIGVSVSPDSRWILYSQLDRSGSNVVVAESIR